MDHVIVEKKKLVSMSVITQNLTAREQLALIYSSHTFTQCSALTLAQIWLMSEQNIEISSADPNKVQYAFIQSQCAVA